MNSPTPDILATHPNAIPAVASRGFDGSITASQAFSGVLRGADQTATHTDAADPVDRQARDAAASLVAITFIQPMLAQARQDPFKSDLFHGGTGEEIFGAQMDSLIAQRMTSRMNLSLVDAVYHTILQPKNGLDTHG